MGNLSTRGRLVILILVAVLPALALTAINTLEQRDAAETQAREEIKRLAKLAAQRQEQIVEGARQTLVALSQILPTLHGDPTLCNDYFAKLLQQNRGMYHSMGIHNSDGELLCNAVPWQGHINVGDRRYFRLSVESGKFAIGDYQVGRNTRLAGVNFGYPVLDSSARIMGVAFLGLDLQQFNRIAAATPLPPHALLTIVDSRGTILARHPAGERRIGQKLRNPRVLDAVFSGRQGTFEAEGTDKAKRVFAYESVAENPDGTIPIRLLVSVPIDVVLADAKKTFARNLIGVSLAMMLLLVVSWYGAEILIFGDFRKLLAAANRMRSGDLGSRTGLHYEKDEVGQLGKAFDEMAGALQRRDLELRQALQDFHDQAITDPLTGLFNRRYLRELLPRELIRAARNESSLATTMIDLDHFKRINDSFGHEAGDLVLRKVAALLNQNVRGSDIVCRYGGEEFALIMPDSTLESAQRRAEEIRVQIQHLALNYGDKPLGRITASFGVALFPDHGTDENSLLRRADDALYEAKRAGRDRVVTSTADRS